MDKFCGEGLAEERLKKRGAFLFGAWRSENNLYDLTNSQINWTKKVKKKKDAGG